MLKPLVLISSLLSVGTAVADPVPQSWKDRYAAMQKTMEKMDVNGFMSFFAKDYVLTKSDGTTDHLLDFLKDGAKMRAGVSHVDLKVKLIRMRSHGDQVEIDFDFVGKLYKKPPLVTNLHEVGIDTWHKTGDHWLLVKTFDSKFVLTDSTAKGR